MKWLLNTTVGKATFSCGRNSRLVCSGAVSSGRDNRIRVVRMLEREPTVYFCPANTALLRGGSRPMDASAPNPAWRERARDHTSSACAAMWGGFTEENAYVTPRRTDSSCPRRWGAAEPPLPAHSRGHEVGRLGLRPHGYRGCLWARGGQP